MIRALRFPLLLAAVAALLPSAIAAPILQPPGLKPGDAYHLAFVTELSLFNINVSDDTLKGDLFVQWSARLAGIDQGPNGPIEWRGLVSSPQVDARDHLAISAPVYLLDGTKIADGPGELWSAGPSSPISINEHGVRHSANQFDDVDPTGGHEVTMVWNGTRSDGTYNAELAAAGGGFSNGNGSLIGAFPSARPCFPGSPNEYLGNALGGDWLLEPGYPNLFPNEACSGSRISHVQSSIRRLLGEPIGGVDPVDPGNGVLQLPDDIGVSTLAFTRFPASLYGFSVRLVVPVPEPGAAALLAMAAVGLAAARRAGRPGA